MNLKNINIYFWFFIFLILLLQLSFSEEYSFLISILFSFVIVFTCYTFAFVFGKWGIKKHLEREKHKIPFLIQAFLASLISAILLTVEDYFIETLNNSSTEYSEFKLKEVLPSFFGMWMATSLIIGVSFAFELYRQHVKTLEKQQRLKEEVMKLELETIRYQLSPHFTFNILNNLQFLIQKNKDDALLLLSKYSVLLRYYVYESQQPMIPLKKEIEFIRNFIGVEQLRIGDELETEINWDISNDNQLVISPFVLSTFVENAFKHISKGRKKVFLDCRLNNNELDFVLKNSSDIRGIRKLGGIGLNQVNKRLELLYANKHHLTIDDKENFYEVNLKIHLSES
jgi:hypothetical protein